MSILPDFSKFKKYLKTANGYKLSSLWTSSQTVEMSDGNTAETNLGAIKGISSSLATDNANYALSLSGAKNLQDQITTQNSNLTPIVNDVSVTRNTTNTSEIMCKTVRYPNIFKVEFRMRFAIVSGKMTAKGVYDLGTVSTCIPKITQPIFAFPTNSADEIKGALINTDGEIKVSTYSAITSEYIYIQGFYYYG